ncbi:hypothetical protein [Sphingosinithalassobacter sp. CS137]|uniref:hypothetical protein n=1 Tax=Sphingosinithalassobacter sp. CS137 TaxID=2762748 RepID=UPI00165D4BC4|nr:hypothetical protein [Sphingosinithalassobacter sp. CS137]
MTLLDRLGAAPRWAVLLTVALAARAITFGNPILHVDEEFYFVTAHAMLDGALPYVEIWDRKPIGLFLLYLPAALFGYPLGIWAYQAMALVAAVATSVLIGRLADRAGWSRGALFAGVAYLLWLNLFEGQGGQAPVFYNLPMVLAATLIAPGGPEDARRRFRRGLLAMLLVGIAIQLKYSAVFEGFFFGLWLLWREWRITRTALYTMLRGAAWAAVALLPTVAALGYYWLIGHTEAFVFANFTSIALRNRDPAIELLGNLAEILLIGSPLIAMCVLAWRCRGGDPAARPVQQWLFAWALAALLGLLAFGSWFNHYALPLLVPGCACAAGFVAAHRSGMKVALPLLVLLFLGGQALLIAKRAGRGTPAEFTALADAVGSGPGCLHVYSGNTMLYVATGRCARSAWRFPSHLGRTRERGAIGVSQSAELERILAERPAMVVVRNAYRGERPEQRARTLAAMNDGYRLRAVRPLGDQQVAVFARSEAR